MDKDYADETAIYVQLSIHPFGKVNSHIDGVCMCAVKIEMLELGLVEILLVVPSWSRIFFPNCGRDK